MTDGIPLILIRHGATNWNRELRFQGQADVPLSTAGREDIKTWKVPADCAAFDWVSSPQSRAVETAMMLGHDPERVPALTEMSWGAWQGQRINDLGEDVRTLKARQYTDGLDFKAPDGESPREVQRRIKPWLKSIHRPTVAVCHNRVILAAYALATDWDMTTPPPSKLKTPALHEFHVTDGVLTINRLNHPLSGAVTDNNTTFTHKEIAA